MVEYDVCICYGVMISDELARQFCNNWDADYYENYVHCVDAWTCDKGWFFGLTKSLTRQKEEPVIAISDINIPKFQIDRFEKLIYREKLEEIVNWNPKYYIINFCY